MEEPTPASTESIDLGKTDEPKPKFSGSLRRVVLRQHLNGEQGSAPRADGLQNAYDLGQTPAGMVTDSPPKKRSMAEEKPRSDLSPFPAIELAENKNISAPEGATLNLVINVANELYLHPDKEANKGVDVFNYGAAKILQSLELFSELAIHARQLEKKNKEFINSIESSEAQTKALKELLDLALKRAAEAEIERLHADSKLLELKRTIQLRDDKLDAAKADYDKLVKRVHMKSEYAIGKADKWSVISEEDDDIPLAVRKRRLLRLKRDQGKGQGIAM